MKKQKILILSIAALTGMILSGCSLSHDDSSNDTLPDTSLIEDEVETSDEVGSKIALRGAITPSAKVSFSSAFGYQVLDKSAASMSVRLIAVVDDYKNLSSAKVTAKVVSPRSEKNTAGDNETVVRAAKSFDVSEVYSSLSDASSISWNGSIESTFAKKYYIIYTLRNVPIKDCFDTIIVDFSATSTEEDAKQVIVNAYGVAGWDKSLTATKVDDTDSDYAITAASYTAGSDVVIPADHFSVTDCYAVKDGTITTLGTRLFGSKINKLTLPDTITTIKVRAFNCITIEEMNIPSNVTSMEAGAFYTGSNYIVTKLIYEAANFSSGSNDPTFIAKNVVIEKGVKSIPDKFFSSYYLSKIESIEYKGTEAEWAPMKTESNANSGFFYLDAVCSDTTYSNVTFHYGEGQLKTNTGDVKVSARNNRLLANPGSPYKTNEEFKGWYTDKDGPTLYDFSNTLVTADLDLYAVYGTPGAGYSYANPLEVDTSMNSVSATLYPGKASEYLKFTVPSTAKAEGDWYYFSIDENYVKDENNSTASSASASISVVELVSGKEAAKTLDSSFYLNKTGTMQKSSSDAGTIRIFAKPGETYYLKATMTSSSNASSSKYWYGSISITHFTYDNDSLEEAISITKGGDAVTPNIADGANHKVVYKYVATEDDTVVISRNVLSGDPVASFYIGEDGALSSSSYVNISSYKRYGFDAKAGHTYYIQVSQTYSTAELAKQNATYTLSLASAPEGYTKAKALSYTMGSTVTVTNVNSTGAYYKFSVSKDTLISVSTTVGSSDWKQKVEVYDADGASKGPKTSASDGKAITGYEVSLSAGDYTIFVGYSYVSTWVNFDFTISEVAEGDSVNLPKAITPNLGTAISLASSKNGKYYKITPTKTNYLMADLSSLPSDVSFSFLNSKGSDITKSVLVRGNLATKTADTYYILKLSGADKDVSLTFTREDAPEIGVDAATAISMDFDSDGLFDLSDYASTSGYQYPYFKFTVTKDATYKLFFQTKKGDTASTSAYTYLKGLYEGDASNPTLVTAKYANNYDKGVHSEAIGTNSGYYEYALKAGTTYYVWTALSAKTSSSYDSVKFGIKEKPVGSGANVAEDAGTVSTDATTNMTVKGNADGYWNKVTIAKTTKASFGLPASQGEGIEANIYKSSDTTNPIVELSSGVADEETYTLYAGDYYVWVKAANATDVTSVSINVSQTVATTSYDVVNAGGSTSAPTTDSTYKWTYDSTTDTWTSGVYHVASNCSRLTYTFNEAGTFTFKYFVSSYYNDYFTVTHSFADGGSDKSLVSKSGINYKITDFNTVTDSQFVAVTITVSAGDAVTMTYSKNPTTDEGLDAAYIKGVTFTAA